MQPLNKAIFLALLLVCSLSCSKSKTVRKLEKSVWKLTEYEIDTETFDFETNESTWKYAVNEDQINYFYLQFDKDLADSIFDGKAFLSLANGYDSDNSFMFQRAIDSEGIGPGEFGNLPFSFIDGAQIYERQFVVFNGLDYEIEMGRKTMTMTGSDIKKDSSANKAYDSFFTLVFEEVYENELPLN